MLVAACAFSASGCRCEESAPPPPIAASDDANAPEAGAQSDAATSDAGEEVEHDDYRDVPMLVPLGPDAAGTPAEQALRAAKLIEARGLPDDYRRALGLANAAHDGGAKVDCRLLDLARDDRRLAECYERSGQSIHLALLVASGRGALRDPERALAMLAASDRKKDCTLDRARAAVNRRRHQTSGRPLAFCGDAACSSADIAECLADRTLRYDWTSSAGRQIIHDRLDDDGRGAYRTLAKAFAAYVEADAKQAARPIDGKKQRFDHHRRFDALLERIAVRHDFPHATDAELSQLAERIASLERQKSESYARYEDAFAAFAKLAVPETADADRRTRALVRRDYIRLLEARAAR
jgi:hypothetical protein